MFKKAIIIHFQKYGNIYLGTQTQTTFYAQSKKSTKKKSEEKFRKKKCCDEYDKEAFSELENKKSYFVRDLKHGISRLLYTSHVWRLYLFNTCEFCKQ